MGDFSTNDAARSSPRVWGQDRCAISCINVPRIIPTRMGTRQCIFPRKYKGGDHPHAYGDKRLFGGNKHGRLGSSPRVWGQDLQTKTIRQKQRIIPTRMGTRNRQINLCNGNWDHPHAYGDKQKIIDGVLQGLGSSPRVWGQVITLQLTASAIRIIPTRMGTSG